jgi:hypothetical protein
MPFCFNCLLDLMGEQRAKKKKMNDGPFTHRDFYARPQVRVISGGWDQMISTPWDHSAEHLDEMIEIAERLGVGAFVTLSQEVRTMDGGEGTFIDDGYEIQIFPVLALREGNEYIAVNQENHTTELVN